METDVMYTKVKKNNRTVYLQSQYKFNFQCNKYNSQKAYDNFQFLSPQ